MVYRPFSISPPFSGLLSRQKDDGDFRGIPVRGGGKSLLETIGPEAHPGRHALLSPVDGWDGRSLARD